MTGTPLWLCLKIQPTKERKAHELFMAHGVTSFYAHEVRRRKPCRHAKRAETYEVPLLTGYAIVAHDGTRDFLSRLRALAWNDGARYRVVRNALNEITGMIEDGPLFEPRPVVQDIKGSVRIEEFARLEAISGRLPAISDAVRLSAGDRARLITGPLQGREVRITIIKGNHVRVDVEGREVRTTLDKLEAA